MNAQQRGSELARLPIHATPKPAFDYVKHLCKKMGMCPETILLAYSHYAECYEGLPKSDDVKYHADQIACAFFKAYKNSESLRQCKELDDDN